MTSGEAVCAVLDSLAAAKIEHMITGGLASNVYGIFRATHDADIVIQTDGADFTSFEQSLPPDIVVDPQISFETITGSRRHILEIRNSSFRIELFFLGDDPHHRERFARRVRQYMAGLEREANVASAEDVIIQKVRWGRDKDRDDVRSVLAVQGSALDFPYIEKWCDIHGTRERLEELRRSIPPI